MDRQEDAFPFVKCLSIVANNSLNPLKIPFTFPVGHGIVKRLLLCAEKVSVMLRYLRAQCLADKAAAGEQLNCLAEGVRDARKMLRGVDVSFKDVGWLDLPGYAI